MLRKRFVGKKIIKRLDQIESEHNVQEKPYFAIIGKLPDGRYEVSEHIGIGKGKGNVKFRSVKYTNQIINSKEEYLQTNPTWTVILDDVADEEESLSVSEICKEALFGDQSKIKILNNERMSEL